MLTVMFAITVVGVIGSYLLIAGYQPQKGVAAFASGQAC